MHLRLCNALRKSRSFPLRFRPPALKPLGQFFPLLFSCFPRQYRAVIGKLSCAALTRCLLRIACLFALTYSFSQQSTPAIRGTVINSVTHEPIARALVDLPSRCAQLTDDEGHFNLPIELPVQVGGLAQFNGQLQTRKPGFTDRDTEILIDTNSPNLDLTIPLVPEALIVGHVNLPASNQYDRANVDVYRRQIDDGRAHWVSVQTTSTRANGDFRFSDLAPGTYKLFTEEVPDRDPLTFNPEGQHFAYPPIYYPNAQDFASATPIQLEAGQTFHAELSPVLQPYFPVKIPITNMTLNSFLEVSVSLQGHKGPGYSLGYNGEQEIEGELPNGTYTIESRVQGGSSRTGITALTVLNAPALNARMTLVGHGSIPVNISSEVSREAGAMYTSSIRVGGFSRRQDADVSIRSAEEFESNLPFEISLRPPRQPNDKSLVLENVPPGHYWVEVRPISPELYPASLSSEGIDLLRNPLVVSSGGSAQPIDIVLRDDGASLDGVVEGLPRAEASTAPANDSIDSFASKAKLQSQLRFIYAYAIPLPDSPGLFAHTQSNSDGAFHMQALAPGTYRILAFDQSQTNLDYRNPEAMC